MLNLETREMFTIKEIGNEKFLSIYFGGKEFNTRIPMTNDGRIILPSGSAPVYRQTVEITYDDFKPVIKLFQNLEQWILHDVKDPKLTGYIINQLRTEGSGEDLARNLLLKSLNTLYKATTVWEDPGSDFECFCQKLTYVLADTMPPTRRGGFFPDSMTRQRVTFLKALEHNGLSRLTATQPGNPGTTGDWCDPKTGLPIYMGIQPYALEAHPMRYAIQRGLSHAQKLKVVDAPYVQIQEAERYPQPPMVNANCVAMDLGLNDAVIISESLAKRLTVLEDDVHTHTLDGLITCRGETKQTVIPSPVKRSWLQKTESSFDIFMRYRRLWLSKYGDESNVSQVRKKYLLSEMKTCPLLSAVCPDVQKRIHLGIYNCAYGDASAESHQRFRKWLKRNDKYVAEMSQFSHLNQPVSRRFPGVGIDRLVAETQSGRSILFKEFHGVKTIPCVTGCKIQSEADWFKGVCVVFPDHLMPWISKPNGDTIRADVVADMAKSTKKHGSLRFSHFTMVLNAIAKEEGMLKWELSNPKSDEWLINKAVKLGLVKDDNLTCDVLNSLCVSKLGEFPCGIIRVCRHRQDPDIVGGVVGDYPKHYDVLMNNLKHRGVRLGFIDTNVQLAFGFDEAAKELRRVTPEAKTKVTALSKVVIFSDQI